MDSDEKSFREWADRCRKEKPAEEGSEELFLEVGMGAYLNWNSFFDLRIDLATLRAWKNGKPFSMDIPPFVSKLLAIVSSWEPRMVNEMILDGSFYEVRILKGGVYYSFEGRNKFPLNFSEFTRLLHEYGVR